MSVEAEFIARPILWPRYPALPLKRRDGNFHADDYTVFILSGRPTRAYIGNVFHMSVIQKQRRAAGKPCKTWGDLLADLPYRDYESVEALLNDYMVD